MPTTGELPPIGMIRRPIESPRGNRPANRRRKMLLYTSPPSDSAASAGTERTRLPFRRFAEVEPLPPGPPPPRGEGRMTAMKLHVVTCVSNPVRFQSRYRLYRDFAKH